MNMPLLLQQRSSGSSSLGNHVKVSNLSELVPANPLAAATDLSIGVSSLGSAASTASAASAGSMEDESVAGTSCRFCCNLIDPPLTSPALPLHDEVE